MRGAIDWGFLTLLSVLLGTGGVLQSGGVEVWIADSLVPRAQAPGSPGVLVVLLGLALVPAGTQLGLSPWVVGFVVLNAANR